MKKIAVLLSSIPDKKNVKEKFLKNNYDEVVAIEALVLPSEIRQKAKLLDSYSKTDLHNVHCFFSEIEQCFTPKELEFLAGQLDSLSSGLLITLFKVMAYCESQLKENAQVHVYSSISKSKEIPLFGYKTVEINKGSDSLLGSVIGKVVKNKFGRKVKIIEQKRDLLCFPSLRYTAFFLYELLSLMVIIYKVTKLKKLQKGIDHYNNESVLIYLCRSRAHIDYALGLNSHSTQNKAALFLFPQPRLGKSAELISSISSRDSSIKLILPSRLRLIGFFFKNTCMLLKKILTKSEKKELTIANTSFLASSLILESKLFLTDSIYRDEILKTLNSKKKVSKLVNFAIKGRFAALDNLIAKALRTKLVTVQSINVVPETAYKFPANDFVCDSRISQEKMKKGYLQCGELIFEGSLFEFSDFDKNVSKINKLIFFTQPYELEVNKEILQFLDGYTQKLGIELIIKIHPRDKKLNYSYLSSNSKFCTASSVKEALQDVDICITKTSAVCTESLALGVPIISVCLSEYDQNLQVESLIALRGLGLCPFTLKHLEKELSDFTLVTDKSIKAREVLFDEKDIKALSCFINNETSR